MIQILACIVYVSSLVLAGAQGVFLFANPGAQTRLGSLDGAYAGTNIYAQMLAGPQADSLVPIGLSHRHGVSGSLFAGGVTVPTVPAYNLAYVQMVAWDSLLWGTDFAQVPIDQLGRTDIVQVYLTSGVFPDVTEAPRFTQPAIVPVPEPSTWALAALACGVALARRRKRHKSR